MPRPLDNPIPGSKYNEEIERKRLRDQFAGRAMEAMLGSDRILKLFSEENFDRMIGAAAYGVADGMMKARDGK